MIIQCQLCPKACRLTPGGRGDCRIRANIDGKLRALTYGRPCSIHVDPIEKKPLFHFYPGSPILSIATAGCNLHCKNCQNWEISQADPETIAAYYAGPQDIITLAAREQCSMIAYTYTDPAAFYEYALDTSLLARERGLKNVLVTAGYLNQAPLKKILAVTDAAHIDLKFFDDRLYREMTSGTLKPVLETLVTAAAMGVWIEIIHLIIPTINDDFEMIRSMCLWIRRNLGSEVPIHFSRFYPQYLLKNIPPTPVETLRRAREIAREAGLAYVYIGNVWGEAEDTRCPHDGSLLIQRTGYTIKEYNILSGGTCKTCGKAVAGRWR